MELVDGWAHVIDSDTGERLRSQECPTREAAMILLHDCLDSGLRSEWTPMRSMLWT